MPRRGENIYKRKDGRWEGRYIKEHCDSKAKYGYVYGKTYAEVKRTLTLKKSEIALEKNKPPDSGTQEIEISCIAALWLADKESILKESTLIKYRNLLNTYIIPIIGSTTISDMDYEMLSDFCNMLLVSGGSVQQGLSNKTVSDVLTVIKSVCRYAERKKYRIDRTALDVSVKIKAAPLRVLSFQEEQLLIDYLKKQDSLICTGILLSLFTGIRIGELCALTWRDISLKQKTIHIHRTMQRIQTPEGPSKTMVVITEPKSLCSIRDIPLSKNIIELMPEPADPKAYFLTGKINQYVEPRTMENHFKRILTGLNIENVHFHTLRHTFATRCVEVGFDIKSLSETLGHANVNITLNRYVHPSMELKQKNMEKLSDLFSVK